MFSQNQPVEAPQVRTFKQLHNSETRWISAINVTNPDVPLADPTVLLEEEISMLQNSKPLESRIPVGHAMQFAEMLTFIETVINRIPPHHVMQGSQQLAVKWKDAAKAGMKVLNAKQRTFKNLQAAYSRLRHFYDLDSA